MTLPIFYKQPVALSSQTHANLRLRARDNYRFAGGTNSVALTAAEFAAACHEYPIVFVQGAEGVNAVALLGLRDGQNLFLDEKGHWNASYIPAYVRRYPFILARQDGEQGVEENYTVCIDESYAGFSQEEGERLFRDDGEQTGFLKQALTLVREFQAHSGYTVKFAGRLQELELLQPLQANVELRAGDKLSLTGFMAVDQARLKALPAETLAGLVQKDELGLLYYHLLSLNNFSRLVDRMAEAA